MNIAILGYGVEGKSTERYFRAKGHHTTVFDRFSPAEIPNFHLEKFDLIFRSPSIPPQSIFSDFLHAPNLTSATRYFFDNCPAQIIGITGTKGKGTTCSLTKAILESIGKKVWLVGNIGTPALDTIDKISECDTIVYELSSFQLWDLQKSPHVAVILRIEPEHLDIHGDFENYLSAKSNIAKHQTPTDYCYFYAHSPQSHQIATTSPGIKDSYPIQERELATPLLDHLAIPGNHNRENAEAAISAASAILGLSRPDFMHQYHKEIASAFQHFHSLPHHIELIRILNDVAYYDDNYSTSYPALDVALKSFHNNKIVLIAGGVDRRLDLTATKKAIFSHPYLEKVILIGETKTKLAEGEDPTKYLFADTLAEAVESAQSIAEAIVQPTTKDTTKKPTTQVTTNPNTITPTTPIVLMSPGAASFDMFENYSKRGDAFQTIVQELK